MEKKEVKKQSDLRKAPVAAGADEALHRMVEITNEGYSGGKVRKWELLSWLILHFEKHSFSTARDDIRRVYFDRISYLSSVVDQLKKAQRAGDSSPDLDSLLAPVSSKTSPGPK